jgi:hypothetical protein
MKWPWPALKLADVLGFAFVIAIICVFAVVVIGFPNFSQQATNAGFGPDWDCTQTGKSEPICIKKIGAPK